MELSKQQKDIIDKIISGEVFDIPSYLKTFCKGKLQKYDIEKLRSSFLDDEKGKLYKVMKDGHSAYMPRTGMEPAIFGEKLIQAFCQTPRKPETIADSEWEERPAELDEKIPILKISLDEHVYLFDFKDAGVFVADSFESIVDFITLWTYLENQALILSVDKPISAEDVGVFFEPNIVESAVEKEKRLESERGVEDNSQVSRITSFFHTDFLNSTPTKKIVNYIDIEWKINKEHTVMCKNFIGKRILVGSALRLYKAQKYKTNEEIAQKHSLTVAWIAVAISLIAVFTGSILPLFQPKETDYLQTISGQIYSISDSIDQINLTPKS